MMEDILIELKIAVKAIEENMEGWYKPTIVRNLKRLCEKMQTKLDEISETDKKLTKFIRENIDKFESK